MKKRILAFVLTLVMLLPSTVFAVDVQFGWNDNYFTYFPNFSGLPSPTNNMLGSTPATVSNGTTNGIQKNDGVSYSKQLITDGDNNMAIQIDAWVEGTVSGKDTEIVFVVDQSGSMYQGADGASSAMSVNDFLSKGPLITENAQIPGYYMAVAKNSAKLDSNHTDWNGNSDYYYDYVSALVRWNPTKGTWQRSRQVRMENGNAGYNNLDISVTFKDIENLIKDVNNEYWSDLSSSGAFSKDYDTKIYKSLYGATIDAYTTLANTFSKYTNTKIAVVGFASSPYLGNGWNGANYGGSGIFFPTGTGTTQFVHTNEIGETTDYSTALMDASNTILVKDAIKRIRTAYSETCTEEGFKLANRIFAASVSDGNTDVNRVVVLFTDGEPTCTSESGHYEVDGYYYPKCAAINAAWTTKNEYGAKVFAYAHSRLADTNNYYIENSDFIEYVSSNYPSAIVDNGQGLTPGTMDTSTNYTGFASNTTELNNAFSQIGQTILQNSNELDELSQIRDTVTPYFEIGGKYNDGLVTVQEIPYSGTTTDGNPVFVATPSKTWTLLSNGQIDGSEGDTSLTIIRENDQPYIQKILDSNGNEKEVTRYGDQIIVSGYDYGAHSIFHGRFSGHKLRLIIPIKPSDAYIGGNLTDTNSADSGIYTYDNTTVPPSYKPHNTFPVPDADVEVEDDEVLDTEVVARAGASILESIPYADILKMVDFKIGNYPVDPTKPDFGFTGDSAWVTDNVYIKVELYDTETNESGDTLYDDKGEPIAKDSPLSSTDTITVRRDHIIYARIWVWSKIQKNGEPAKPNIPTQSECKSSEGKIELTIYYPTFVFNDVSMYYGERLDEVIGSYKKEYDAMNATPYLQWYTNEKFEQLQNPEIITTDDGKKVPAPLNPPSDFNQNEVFIQNEVPYVYFKVDPIDDRTHPETSQQSVRTGTASSVDAFYQTYGNYMLKQPIGMNVRVYFVNENDIDPVTGKLIGNLEDDEHAMRNAFFLHTTCKASAYANCKCGLKGCNYAKHKSGSKDSDDEYWKREFYINYKTCDLTIRKENGTPGETYVFEVYTTAPVITNAYGKEAGTKVLYTTISITVDENGCGKQTIFELPVGDYWVEEDLAWSWRYGENEPEVTWNYFDSAEIKKGNNFALEPNEDEDRVIVTFTNQSKTDKWLTGLSSIFKNIFGESTSEKTVDRSESPNDETETTSDKR